jgi:hypothetical protein
MLASGEFAGKRHRAYQHSIYFRLAHGIQFVGLGAVVDDKWWIAILKK